MRSESRTRERRSAHVLTAGVALVVAFSFWTYIRGVALARLGEERRFVCWDAARNAWDESEDRRRTTDFLRTLAGVVLDEASSPVAGAEVAVIDLDRIALRGPPLAVDAPVRDDWVEARGTTADDGTFRFADMSLGPKAVLARRGDAASVSRRVWSVLDGVPLSGVDLRVARPESIRLTLESAPSRDLTCWPVLDAFHLDPVPACRVVGGVATMSVPPAARIGSVLVRDDATGTVKLFALDRGDTPARLVRTGFRMASVGLPGVPDGVYEGVSDDLDFGVADLGTLRIAVAGQIASVPVFAGRTGVTIRTPTGPFYVRIPPGVRVVVASSPAVPAEAERSEAGAGTAGARQGSGRDGGASWTPTRAS